MRNRGKIILYGAVIFAVFMLIFVFLTRVHPLVVFDGDDWAYLSYTRAPLPKWGDWNPTRVLPETVLPIIGYISAYFVYPILGDYLRAMTYSYAFVIAVMFTVLCCMLHHFLVERLNLPSWQAVLLAGIFIAAHFGLFKSREEGNSYMLWAPNLICYYYYVVPSLLNAALVLFFISKQDVQQYFFDQPVLNRILIITAVYFAIYSNIFQSLILTVYCGVQLILKFIDYKNFKGYILNFLKDNSVYLGIIFFWLLGCIFEVNGGRSAALGKQHGLLLQQAFFSFVRLVKEINHAYLMFLLLSVIFAGIVWYRSQGDNSAIADNFSSALWLCGLSGVLVTIGLLLVSAKAAPVYAGAISAMYGVFFYVLLFVIITFVYILENTNLMQYLLPLIAACLLMSTLSSDRVLRESNMGNHAPSSCAAVSKNLIRQIKAADQKGLKKMTLVVPKGDNNDNWPHPKYMGSNIARTLYAHGQIDHKIEIKIRPDMALNKKYY